MQKEIIKVPKWMKKNLYGEKYKTSIEKRVKNCKFAKIIKELSDEELITLCMVVGFSSKTLEAIKTLLIAQDNAVQFYALKLEIDKRELKNIEFKI